MLLFIESFRISPNEHELHSVIESSWAFFNLSIELKAFQINKKSTCLKLALVYLYLEHKVTSEALLNCFATSGIFIEAIQSVQKKQR